MDMLQRQEKKVEHLRDALASLHKSVLPGSLATL